MRLDLALFALVAPLAVLGDLRHSQRRTHSHHEVAKRAEGHVQLHKRFSNSRWTFYDVGGAPYVINYLPQLPSDAQLTLIGGAAALAVNTTQKINLSIVALNSAQYGGGYPGPNCWRKIVMQIGDKKTTATITDECPGCPYGGLDLTRGLFEFFDSLDVGVLSGNWWFADEGDDGGSPPPPPKKTTTTYKPKPTTTWKPDPPKPTTHYTPTTTHTTEQHTSTTHSSTHSSTQSSSASSSAASSHVAASFAAVPTGVASAETSNVQNILTCNKVLVNMGGLVVAGVQA
ncbi:hypothetical protein NP233_g7077 [Leucocoprinus birnbaumii]|uniref:Uncharacterized protein n=1 Tax=Leucocoprinus birnbaumii TaxID=56174 RepID=A0AAD5YUY5_9AGAR|nr:hypothetical protein NP233_g7077 [Leucocoprinus birnbaumii]